MAVDEHTRYRLHDRLTETIGDEMATALMEHLPPSGWNDVVRRSDLDAFEKRMDLRFEAVKHQIRVELHQEIGLVHQEIGRMHQEIGQVHQEIGRLRQEFAVQTRTFLLTLVGLTLIICTFALTAARLV